MVEFLPEAISIAVVLVAVLAEIFHLKRIGRVKYLAFGPRGKPAVWTWLVPVLRPLCIGMACWGFLSLILVVNARTFQNRSVEEKDFKHLILAVDVSPSMQIEDAGPEGDRTRRQRASDIVESIFARLPMRKFKLSFIAVYSDAKPLLRDSKDHEVVRHIMEKLPMWHAFEPGKTKLISGIREAAKMAKTWNPKSTHVVVLTDGDSAPAAGMPKMPASVDQFLVVGVGNPTKGTFIDGHQSRQDMNSLQLVAKRLGGSFHNGNQKLPSSQVVGRMASSTGAGSVIKWTRREWALLACIVGTTLLSLIPVLLHYFGTGFVAGVKYRNQKQMAA